LNFVRCSPAEGTNAAVEDQVLRRTTFAAKPTSISGYLKGRDVSHWRETEATAARHDGGFLGNTCRACVALVRRPSEPLTDSVREPLDSYGSCHRTNSGTFYFARAAVYTIVNIYMIKMAGVFMSATSMVAMCT
jgi:hypothetical protein